LADAHVHIYDCFDLGLFFDAAARNLRTAAQQQGRERGFTRLLLLAESSDCDWFRTLAGMHSIPRATPGPPWLVCPSREPDSLRLEGADGDLLLVAGRQIATRENLEVLALATHCRFEDGAPLDETIREVSDGGGVPVVPWGCGKWWGRRGALLRRYLAGGAATRVFLGDNSARPVFWPRPTHFALVGRQRILSGSDPLPFASEIWRPGSVGFAFDARIDRDTPARDLRRALASPDFAPRPYGARERPYRFLRNQIAMQVRKRHSWASRAE
jgi:hypothetical protein